MASSPDKDIIHAFFPTFVSVSNYYKFAQEKDAMLAADLPDP